MVQSSSNANLEFVCVSHKTDRNKLRNSDEKSDKYTKCTYENNYNAILLQSLIRHISILQSRQTPHTTPATGTQT